jgi:hypothetical protein
MMNRRFICVALFVLIVLSACEKKENARSSYYPIDSLISSQVEYLKTSKAVLTKKAEIDGVEETNSYRPQSDTAWTNELDIFSELKVINNSGNAGRYDVQKGVKDSNSNLSVDLFTGKGTLPVVYLKTFYLHTPSQIRRIEALYQEENALVKGSRLLILEFQRIGSQVMLTSYSIEGSQKMFLGESVKFSIQGTISLP